ncbi:MAG TPA: alpha/beta hydrolase [Blastocatellia bacterium]|nr:alpha/beta hydrolase [Blastocatellia bacterium]
MKMKPHRPALLISFLILLLPACAQQPANRAATIEVPAGTTVHRDQPYVTGGHERQKLDLYLPPQGGKRPLIIWIHGGGWQNGSKDNPPALRFLAEGYAVASINYRLSQHAIFPAQIEDCKAAVRWLRANAQKFGLDPNRFGVWGPSAGGHLAALLGTSGDVKEFDVGEKLNFSSRVQAVCDFFGPTDFLQMDAHRLTNGMVHDTPDSPEAKLIGGPIQQNKAKVARANPITYVTPDDPPFLIAHGDADPLVPHHQSKLLAEALLDARVNTNFYTVPGGGHGGFRDERLDLMVKEFFEAVLKQGKAEAGPK